MSLAWLKGLARSGSRAAVKHAPEILMTVGTVGIVAETVYLIKIAPEVSNRLEQAQMEKIKIKRQEWNRSHPSNEDHRPFNKDAYPLTIPEKIKAVGPLYAPPIGIAILALSCFWCAHGIDKHRQMIVTGLLATAEETAREYQQELINTLGKAKHDDIQEAIAERKSQEICEKDPQYGLPPATPGDIWFNLYGEMFPSTYWKVKEAFNDFNHDMLNNLYGSVAELKWKLDPSGQWLRPKGDDGMIGWSIDRLLCPRIANPLGPVALLTYEDKDGLDYKPIPSFQR